MNPRSRFKFRLYIAGDTLKWERRFPAYRAADGWQLSYVLVNDPTKITIDASCAVADSEHPDQFDVTVPAATTAAWQPGQYSWQAFVTNPTLSPIERHTVGMGKILVQADFGSMSTGQDQRTHNQKMFDAICAVLEGRATSDVYEYTIGSRHVAKMNVTELETWKRTYAWRVARENGRAPMQWGAKFTRPY